MDGLGITGPLRNGTNKTLDRPGTILAVVIADIACSFARRAMPPIPGDTMGLANSILCGFCETWKVNIITS